MLKKSFLLILTLLVVLSLALPAIAFEGKITAINDSILVLSATSLPEWVQKGAVANTSSGLAKVNNVDGLTFELKVKKSTAESLKVGDNLDIKPKNKGAGNKLQGC